MANIQNVALNTGLTHYARGVKFMGHIAEALFPEVVADHLEGSYWSFGYGDFGVENQGPFALDSPYLEYEWDIDTETFQINNYGYTTRVADLENANASNILALPRKKIRRGMRYLTTQMELIAKNVMSNETATGFTGDHLLDQSGARWSAADTDPRKAVYKAKNQIRQEIGVEGNAMVIPADVRTALATIPAMREGFQYVREGPLTAQSIGLQFEIDPSKIYIGKAIYNSAKKGQTRAMKDIWTNDCYVFYQEDMPEGSPPEDAGLGACFKLRGWEKTRVVESQIPNPPGMMYVLQKPYDIQVINYKAGVKLKGCLT